RPSLAAPQSQNPRRSTATPAVLLNRCNQILPKSGRDPGKLTFSESLKLTTLSEKYKITPFLLLCPGNARNAILSILMTTLRYAIAVIELTAAKQKL
ncbi:MAG: hypothetical protein KKC76_13875, partial [Proteobacteria bacterium]|nr:hypothetical protein [Pseudomonadota bacterium]MBU4297245.1 hypothetical protein [Pseudomonadota bacterium]MCG2750100.1 hypothetical protein [Desulfobulbaceae bacterium]